MNRLTRLALNEPWVTVLVMTLLLVFGIAAAWSMNEELIPDIDFPQASVIAIWPGASACQVTNEVVKPIESALDSVTNIDVVEVSSTASQSYGAVTLRAEYGTTQSELRDAIEDGLADLELPDDVEDPQVLLFNFSDIPVVQASASGNLDLSELQQLMEDEVVPELEAVDGVSQVSVSGGQPERIFVTLDLDAMAEAGITLDTVQGVFAANNLSFPVGTLRANGKTIPLQVGHRFETLESLDELVIRPAQPAIPAAGAGAAAAMGAPVAEEAIPASAEDAPAEPEPTEVPPDGGPYPLTPLLIALGFETTDDLTPEIIRDLEEADPELLRAVADDVIEVLPRGTVGDLPEGVVDALPEEIRDDLVDRVGYGDETETDEGDTSEPTVRMRAVVIRDGDTVESIADRFGVEPEAIREANDLDDDELTTGDLLRVPEPEDPGALPSIWGEFGVDRAERITPSILSEALEDAPSAVSDLTAEQLLLLPDDTIEALPEPLISRQSPDVAQELRERAARAETIEKSEQVEPQAEAFPEMLPAVLLGDIATVERGLVERQTINRTDGETSVSLIVAKEQSANTVAVSEDVLEVLEDLESEDALRGVEFNVAFEQGSFITESLDGVIREGLLGAVFAIIAILVFLSFSIRATIIAGISIPLSVFIGLLLMRLTGLTLNLLTISGLTVAIGRVVDDSIVVLENIYRHIQRGERRIEAIIDGTREVATAILASTLVTVAVFLPLGFIGGLTKEFFLPFGLTVTYALAASFVVAITIVPVLSRLLLSQAKLPEDRETWLQRLYTPSLEWALDHRWITLLLATVLFFASLALLRFIPQTFLPDFGEPQISVEVALEPGTALEITDEVTMQIEEVILQDEDIGVVQATVGSAGGFEAFFAGETGGNSAAAAVYGGLSEDFEGDAEEVGDRIRDELEEIVFEMPVTLTVSAAALGGPGGSLYDLQIQSDDEELLRDANARILAALEDEENWEDYDDIPIVNLESNLTGARDVVSVLVDPEKALEKGLTAAQVALAIRPVLEGVEFGDIELIETETEDIEGDEPASDEQTTAATTALTVEARFPTDTIESVAALEDFLIAGPAGMVRLADVATVDVSPGPVVITRVDGERAALLTGELKDEDTFGVIADADAIIEDLELPDEVEVGPGVETRTQQEGFENTVLALPVSILIVYLIMAVTFGSLVHPFTILFSLPFALTGALVALALSGRPVSISSLIGMLMLVGIVVTNAIVLVDLVQQYRKRGMDCRTALVRGGRIRLRPILMTAVATVLALLPLSLGLTEGAIIAAELATVVIGGLVTSTLLTLIVVPVVYSILDPLRGQRSPLPSDTPPNPPQVPDLPGGNVPEA